MSLYCKRCFDINRVDRTIPYTVKSFPLFYYHSIFERGQGGPYCYSEYRPGAAYKKPKCYEYTVGSYAYCPLPPRAAKFIYPIATTGRAIRDNLDDNNLREAFELARGAYYTLLSKEPRITAATTTNAASASAPINNSKGLRYKVEALC
ncbi:hypothetical protein ACRALDRAFT_1069311 [Sodiomyces alcalophilus JCM 7366]|uniref:uncharacterized protein n=1 Tax=Sodiomyces alcalophilus JCM 7366 TaxID=591952 RepID=UPI0039B3E134